MTRWTNTGFVAWIFDRDLDLLKTYGSMNLFRNEADALNTSPSSKPVRVRIVLERAKPNAVKRERKRAERARQKSKAPTTRRK